MTEPILKLVHIGTGKEFVLPNKKEIIYIGRENQQLPVDVDLSGIPDADVVSRVHFTIHIERQNYYLEDYGSLNGTFVNNQEVKFDFLTGDRYRSLIQSGDMIILGKNKQLKFVFKVEE